MKNANEIIEKLKNEINLPSFMESNRRSKKDFLRERKLNFSTLITFMLNTNNLTLQKELTEFMRKFTDNKNVTKGAYSQQRIKLKAKAFKELNNVLVNEFYTDEDIFNWKGFRLLSIDGSTLELPKSIETISNYGVNNNTPMAKISTLYDLKNNIILNSAIEPNNSNELMMAFNMLNKTKEKDLLILDRGYGARWLFMYLKSINVDYLVRVQKGFGKKVDAFWNSNQHSIIIDVNELSRKSSKQCLQRNIEFKPFKFRLVKVTLDNGEIEVLATSLLNEIEYPSEIFKKLYFVRWGIEVNYDHLKNHIELANFTGYSKIAIEQDFFASMLIANIQALIIRDAQVELNKKMENKDIKYKYKVNRNLSLSFMKDRIIEILTGNNPDYMEELKELFQISPVQIKPNRKNLRPTIRYKRKWYMNQRRAI
jgi:hypothetical protein